MRTFDNTLRSAFIGCFALIIISSLSMAQRPRLPQSDGSSSRDVPTSIDIESIGTGSDATAIGQFVSRVSLNRNPEGCTCEGPCGLDCPCGCQSNIIGKCGSNCDLVCDSGCDAGCGYRCCSAKTIFQWSCCPAISDGDDELEPLVTDRPDFTESGSTVGLGVVQIEMGYTFTRDDDGRDFDEHSFGEPLFRIGMFREWFELRIGYNYINEREIAGTNRNYASGSEDLYLGVKLDLTEQCEYRPDMALIIQATVPTGSDTRTADEFLPGVNWIYGWDLSDDVSLAGSTQVNRAVDDTGNAYSEFAQSVALGVGLTDCLGSYFEYYGFYPSSAVAANVTPEHYFNGGLTLLLSPDVQLDWRLGVGLNDAADDFFTGFGLSVRL